MNLFRSEEHARNHSGFDAAMADRMLKPAAEWARIFSNPIFRQRGRSDYITWSTGEAGRAAIAQLRGELQADPAR